MRFALITGVVALTLAVFYSAIQTLGSPAMAATPAEVDSLRAQIIEKQTASAAMERDLAAAQDALSTATAERNAAQTSLETAQTELAAAQGDLAALNDQLATLQQNQDDTAAADTVAALEGQIADLQSAVVMHESTITDQTAQLTDAAAQVDALTQMLDAKTAELASFQSAAASNAANADDVTAQLAVLAGERDALAVELAARQSDIDNLTAAGVALSTDAADAIAALRADLAAQSDAQEAALQNAADNAARAEEQAVELAALKADFDTLQTDLAAKSEKIASLQSDMDEFTPLMTCQARVDEIFAAAQITFAAGTPELTEPAQDWLDSMVPVARDCMASNLTLRIEGHTDSAGSETGNLSLSHERAIAVRAYLEAQDLPIDAMRPVAFGEYDPIADNDTPEGRAENRRIAFVWDMN